jgi:NAD(P)-dependent dehydrogenase (short-subunit alcohol dehydrogenase family)
VVADVDERGAEVAAAIGGRFARCDVREQADNEAAVTAAVTAFGGLDEAFLNAGVSTMGRKAGRPGLGSGRLPRSFGVNVVGVFFGGGLPGSCLPPPTALRRAPCPW